MTILSFYASAMQDVVFQFETIQKSLLYSSLYLEYSFFIWLVPIH